MPTLGTGTYPNGGKFNFPRSYIPTFDIRVDTAVTHLGDGHYIFPDGGAPLRTYHVIIFDKFFPWSSNKYSIDFVIEASYFVDAPATTEFPMSFHLVFAPSSPGVNGLVFLPFGLPFTTSHIFTLPPPPPDYWTPIPS